MSRRDKAPDITCLACEVASRSVEVRVKEVRKIIRYASSGIRTGIPAPWFMVFWESRDRAAEANALFELLMPNIPSEVYVRSAQDRSQLDELDHGRILAPNVSDRYDLDNHLEYRENIHHIFADIDCFSLPLWSFWSFYSGDKNKNRKVFIFINPESEAERAQAHKIVGFIP